MVWLHIIYGISMQVGSISLGPVDAYICKKIMISCDQYFPSEIDTDWYGLLAWWYSWSAKK
jgi:hypothetical protein